MSTNPYRDKVLFKLSVKCSNPKCRWLEEDGTLGCRDARILQIDHVNGGGVLHRESVTGFGDKAR